MVALAVPVCSTSDVPGNELANLLSSFVRFLKVPLKVGLFVCWDKEKAFTFAREMLVSENVGVGRLSFMQVKNDSVENLAYLDTTEYHQHLVAVDISCPGVGPLLSGAGFRLYHRIRNTHIDTITRISYHHSKNLLVEYMNATIEKTFTTTWGYFNATTGRFDGVAGQLIENTTEFSGTLLLLIQDRLKHIDYLKMPIIGYLRLIFKVPKLSITENIFRMPFDNAVWGSLLALVLTTVALSLAMNKFNIQKSRKEHPTDSAFDIVPVALQQGTLLIPKSVSQQIFILIGLVGLMFIFTSFSAKIISLIQAPSERIKTIQDLLESRIEAGAHDVVYNKVYLAAATEPSKKAFYKKKIQRRDGSLNMYKLEEGVAKLRQGLFAFHGYTPGIYHVISETFDDVEKCSLRELSVIERTPGFLVMQKNYTLREHLQVGDTRIFEVGVFNREHRRIMTGKPGCVKGTVFQPLSAIDVRFSMQVMACGIGIAALVLLLEILVRWYQMRQIPLFQYLE
ncbi:uncharacterized protein LOC129753733 [Uranotaenia lowii]|uniref:uncharacterized protein LOC129753733 n=1 Tax=Uranotaenia lowii TaxID=190385 RepID=UPI0024797D88|nr:uncharacterized protein LOC129753733 [Uranotaenia lowii]